MVNSLFKMLFSCPETKDYAFVDIKIIYARHLG